MRYIFFMLMVFAVQLVAIAANPDLNGDGKINHTDYKLLTASIVRGSYNVSYDMNNDGILDAVDANLLLDYIPTAGSKKTYTVNDVSFVMVAVEGKTFTMGKDYGLDDYEKPAHSVTLSDFYIGQTEVTEGLWQAVMDTTPSYNKMGNDFPVEDVSWDDCQLFISKLNELTGETFRLPTEAEWEFAAHNDYYYTTRFSNYCWNRDNATGHKHKVATLLPNELGLYDMSGNVYEWCNDWYGSYGYDESTDPVGPDTGTYRVVRGGAYNSYDWDCHERTRGYHDPNNGSQILGLRLAK